MSQWKYTNASNTVVVSNDGRESCIVSAIADWLAEGNTPEPADIPPEPTYQQLRAAEYNRKSTGEQFAMMYDDAVNGTTTWVDWQDGIKAGIPKPPIAT